MKAATTKRRGRAALAMLGWAALAAAGCGDDVDCAPGLANADPARQSIELRLERQGEPGLRVTDMFTVQPGQRLNFWLQGDALATAERGHFAPARGENHNATYTAPTSGADDRLRLQQRVGDVLVDRGWVAVRVERSGVGLSPACAPSALRMASGATPTLHRRTVGPSTVDVTACSRTTPLVEVPFYRVRQGELLRIASPDGWDTGMTELRGQFSGVVSARTAADGDVELTGGLEGWVAVHLRTAGPSQCRYTVLVEVTPALPVDASTPLDVGMDVTSGLDVGPPLDVGMDAGMDVGTDLGTDAGTDAGTDVPMVPDTGMDVDMDAGVTTPTTAFPFTDVIPFGLLEFAGGLFWYDLGNHDLHRFDLATTMDRVVLAGVDIALRDLVAADGRLFWTTGTASMTQVVAWRPGDAAPTAPLLSGARVFDQLLGDGARVYAHEQAALQWMLSDGTMPQTAASSPAQRGFHVSDNRVYFADLGFGGSARGVFRVALSPPPATLLGARTTVIPGAMVMDDEAIPGSLVVSGTTLYGLGVRRLLRASADGTGTATELARFPATASPVAAWTRMCLARGRMYMVEQAEGRLWSVPIDGSAPVASVASPAGIGFSLVCTADSVWWWSGPQLNRYRLP